MKRTIEEQMSLVEFQLEACVHSITPALDENLPQKDIELIPNCVENLPVSLVESIRTDEFTLVNSRPQND
jgi:hypothetical protein